MPQIDYVYFGTSRFAGVILDKLINSNIAPKLVVTVSGKPIGRNQQIQKSAVFDLCLKYDLPVKEIDSLNSDVLIEEISSLKCPLGILAALGKIVPLKLLQVFPYGIINLHPSLLPMFRGPSPIQYALLNGLDTTGITIIKLDEQLDHGPIVAQAKTAIKTNETYIDLEARLAELGANLLIKTIPVYLSDKITLIPQNHQQATITKKIIREHGLIDWQKSAKLIYDQWRAYFPWPGIFTYWNDENLKLLNIEFTKLPSVAAGLVHFVNNILYIDTTDYSLIINKLQLAGGKPLTAIDFIHGHKNFINTKLIK
ncbi:MAG: methionyl-tRNA formyltransferase [Patescibacteria group bacterium]